MIDNIRFQKSEEFIEVKDGKYLMNIDTSTTKYEDTILIDLPSIEIHTHVNRKNKIDQEIHDSIVAFIHREINIKGEKSFIDHMESLGFEKKSIDSAIEPTVFAKRASTLREYSSARRSTI